MGERMHMDDLQSYDTPMILVSAGVADQWLWRDLIR